MFQKFIGDRAFYKRVLTIAIPIIIQNGITNFVSLLDNIMVGQVGTVPMSGVSIVNGLIFVFNLCVFGASSGAGIFTAQFHGSGNQEGIRHTVRFKLMVCTGLSLAGAVIFLLGGEFLIGLYLRGDGDAATAAGAMEYGMKYLKIMAWGFLPFALSNAYSSTLRETGRTDVPMLAGITAVLVNLCGNYILIFGHFGAPALGVEGAAIATVLSRFVELGIVAGWTHLHKDKNPYARGLYRSMYLPGRLLKKIILKGMPLLVNEFFWATGIAIMNQAYSTCGLDVVPAMNIYSTISNLSSVVYMSMGNTVGIIMGQLLGSGMAVPEVRDNNRKLMTLSVMCGILFGGVLAMTAPFFPALYNTTENVRSLAGQLILVGAVMMPFHSYANATYFTLRSGGQTMITFLFDCCYVWATCVPLAFCLSRFTDLAILPLFMICQLPDVLKVALGAAVVKQGKWIQNLTQV